MDRHYDLYPNAYGWRDISGIVLPADIEQFQKEVFVIRISIPLSTQGIDFVVIYSFFAKKAFDEQENPVQVLIVFL